MIFKTDEGYKFEENRDPFYFVPDEVRTKYFLEVGKLDHNFISTVQGTNVGVEEKLELINNFLEQYPRFYTDVIISLFYNSFDVNKVYYDFSMSGSIIYFIQRYVGNLLEDINNHFRSEGMINISSQSCEDMKHQTLFLENNSYFFLRDIKSEDVGNGYIHVLSVVQREV